MRPPTIIERVQDWLRYLPYSLGLKCAHNVVPMFTMEYILERKWQRISGSGECSRCGLLFNVSVAADEEELMSEHYLGRV